jgi:hypothetical protein
LPPVAPSGEDVPPASPCCPSDALQVDGDSIDAGDVEPAPSSAATALAPMAEVWQRLLTEHVPDRQGRCVACKWQTRAADRWPCAVYDLAAAAQRAATTSTPPGR